MGRVYAAFDSVQADITSVLGAMELFDAQTAAADIEIDAESFVEDAEELKAQLENPEQKQWLPSDTVGWAIAGLLFLWLLWIFRTLSKNDRIRAAVAQDQNE